MNPDDIDIRWLIRRDMPEVLRIESESFEEPWPESVFLDALRQRNCIGMVAELGDRILGFMVYELHKSRVDLIDFAVCPSARRQGAGTKLATRLTDKLSQQRRKEVRLTVRERNLDAQMFFRSLGFRATKVIRNFYPDEDAYEMSYRIDEPIWKQSNRITEYRDV